MSCGSGLDHTQNMTGSSNRRNESNLPSGFPVPGAPGTAFNIGGAPAPVAPNPRPPPPPPGAIEYRFDISGTPVISTLPPVQPTVVQWPGANGRTAVIVGGDVPGARPSVVEKPGPGALFRLVDNGAPSPRGDRMIFTVVAGGKALEYSISANSARNPFTMQALKEFRCPGVL